MNVRRFFAMMPFAEEFDDVYMMMQFAGQDACDVARISFNRLDEVHSPGRISADLLAELESSEACVADLTGTNPNVMWELGYAMAIKKPTIVITQDISSLPFDIHDQRAICYRRSALNSTLRAPLAKALRATVSERLGASNLFQQASPAINAKPVRTGILDTKSVFISYSLRSGTPYFSELSEILMKFGFTVLTGFGDGAGSGEYVLRRIRHQVNDASMFISILTKEMQIRTSDGSYIWAPSVWALEERGMALALEKPVFLLVEEGLHGDFWRKTTPGRIHENFQP